MDDETLNELVADESLFPGAKSFVGISIGAVVIRWGPYEPAVAGQFATRMLELDPEHKVPFFIGVQCDPVDDPIETMRGLGFFDPDAEQVELNAESEGAGDVQP